MEIKSYHAVSMIDPDAPQIIRDQLDEHQRKETLLTPALREVVANGNIPYPDQLITGNIEVDLERLYLDYGGNPIITCLRKGSVSTKMQIKGRQNQAEMLLRSRILISNFIIIWPRNWSCSYRV